MKEKKYSEYSGEIRDLHRSYFTDLGDLCWIFYLDYKTKLARKQFPIAKPILFRYENNSVEFDLEEELKINDENSPFSLFIDAVSFPFRDHIVTKPLSRMLETYDRIPSDFLEIKIFEAENKRSRLPSELVTGELGQEVYGGFKSGVMSLTQFYLLKRIFPEVKGFHSAAPIYLTHLSVPDLSVAQAGIGIYDEKVQPLYSPLFSFLDLENSRVGLNESKLRKLDYNNRPPCPATFQPSEECKQYIVDRFGIQASGIVLFDLRDILPPAIIKYLLEPFKRLVNQNSELVEKVAGYEKELLLGKIPSFLK